MNKFLVTLTLIIVILCPIQAKIIYVSEDADQQQGAQTGDSWSAAFYNLADALCAASTFDGDTIWVAEGQYSSTLDKFCQQPSNGKETTNFINKDLHIYGGFKHGDLLFTDRDPKLNVTSLRGGPQNLSNNDYHVIWIEDATCILDGFTVEYGFANGPTTNDKFGGGIFIEPDQDDLSVQIIDCIVQHNESVSIGGGIFSSSHFGGSTCLTLRRCSVDHNEAEYGGGIYSRSIFNLHKLVLENCLLTRNIALSDGGAMSLACTSGRSQTEIYHSTFAMNRCWFSGPAIKTGLFMGQRNSTLINQCIFSENEGPNQDIRNDSNDSVTMVLINCMIDEADCNELDNNGDNEVTCMDNMIYGQYAQFADTANDDFRLLSVSPAIDAGILVEFDDCIDQKITAKLDYKQNLRDDSADYGAYEYECLTSLNLDQELITGKYLAGLDIQSSGDVKLGANVHFGVGQTVLLEPGFTVPQNCTFTIEIEGCY